MSNIFQWISFKKPKRYYHNLTHQNILSFNQGELVPVYWEEVLPGDKMSVSIESLIRFAPMVSPMMTRNNLRFYAFYVPNRIVDESWQEFIFGKEDGSEGIQRRLSIINLPNQGIIHRLADYLGYVPLSSDVSSRTCIFSIAYPYLSYIRIWNEYFRDQNLQDEINPIIQSDGTYHFDYGLRRKSWEKDYFTSALPFLQRGPASRMPIDFTSNSIETELSDGIKSQSPLYVGSLDGSGSVQSLNGTLRNTAAQDADKSITLGASGQFEAGTLYPKNLSNFLTAETTLSEIEASFLINDFRRANQLQVFLEKNARAGARPKEQLKAHFNVNSSDARLQRPEFLGAMTNPISISEVLQHSETQQNGTPLGEMGGHGIGVSGNRLFRNKYFEEHGIVMVLACVVPRSSYYGGLDRRLIKLDRFSYYWPEFARIGEQPVYKSELFFNNEKIPDYESPSEVFGYQERYAEYRYRNDEVHGKMQTDLSFWHQSRSFDSSVSLNGDFVTCKPSDRIFALQDDDSSTEQIYANMLFKVNMLRPVSPRGVPSL